MISQLIKSISYCFGLPNAGRRSKSRFWTKRLRPITGLSSRYWNSCRTKRPTLTDKTNEGLHDWTT